MIKNVSAILKLELKAFTILEVTISMLIAALSMAIAFAAYTIMNSSYRDFDTKNRKLAEWELVERQLSRDFELAGIIRSLGDGIVLKDDSGLIAYHFTENYILRDQYGIRTDTLQLPVSDFSSRFENRLSDIGNTVDKLYLQIPSGKEPAEMSFFKLYSARDLIENETSN